MNLGQTTPFTRFVRNDKVMKQISSEITRKSIRTLPAFARQHDSMMVGVHIENAETRFEALSLDVICGQGFGLQDLRFAPVAL